MRWTSGSSSTVLEEAREEAEVDAGVVIPMAEEEGVAAGEVGPTRMAAVSTMTTTTLGTTITIEEVGGAVVVVETHTTTIHRLLKVIMLKQMLGWHLNTREKPLCSFRLTGGFLICFPMQQA